MRPIEMERIGEELGVKWDDGSESYVGLELLRRRCPCAECQGETDVLGNLYEGPERELTAKSFDLKSLASVGGYAVQPVWADGHQTGLYTYQYLKRLAGGEGA